MDRIAASVKVTCFDEEPELTGEQRKAAHEAAQERRLAEHLQQCGAPRRVVESISTGGLRETAAILGVRQWLRSGLTFCSLDGGVGTGKTLAACQVLRMARRGTYFYADDGSILTSWSYSSREGLFVRAAELASTSPYAEEGKGQWARVRDVSLLILDDLGVERMDNAGIWAQQLDMLIDARYAGRLRTIITSNLDRAAFIERYGARVMDRLESDGLRVACGGDSLRGRSV